MRTLAPKSPEVFINETSTECRSWCIEIHFQYIKANLKIILLMFNYKLSSSQQLLVVVVT